MYGARFQAYRWSYYYSDIHLQCSTYSPPTDKSERGLYIVYGGYYYLLLKLSDLLDTVRLLINIFLMKKIIMFLQQICLGIFCIAQTNGSHFIFTCLPSCWYGFDRLFWYPILSWWPRKSVSYRQ